MKTAWLLENDIFEENLDELKSEIKSQGMDIIETKYIPFQGGSYSHLLKDYDLVIFYGSLNLARQLNEENHPNLVIYSTIKNYECTKYYAYLGEFLLNNDYIMVPFSELKRRKDWIFDLFGRKGQIFVRPSSGEKTFTGQLINNNEFDKDYKLLGSYDVDPHAIVLISTPKDIIKEWRLVVANMEVITGSLYHDNTLNCDYIGFPKEIGDYAKKVLEVNYEPDRIWTMDICQTKDKELHLLEIGSFSCAGLYEANKRIVVDAVSGISKREFKKK